MRSDSSAICRRSLRGLHLRDPFIGLVRNRCNVAAGLRRRCQAHGRGRSAPSAAAASDFFTSCFVVGAGVAAALAEARACARSAVALRWRQARLRASVAAAFATAFALPRRRGPPASAPRRRARASAGRSASDDSATIRPSPRWSRRCGRAARPARSPAHQVRCVLLFSCRH